MGCFEGKDQKFVLDAGANKKPRKGSMKIGLAYQTHATNSWREVLGLHLEQLSSLHSSWNDTISQVLLHFLINQHFVNNALCMTWGKRSVGRTYMSCAYGGGGRRV